MTGTNVEFYPSNAKLVATDPNPYMEKYFQESMEKVKFFDYAITCYKLWNTFGIYFFKSILIFNDCEIL